MAMASGIRYHLLGQAVHAVDRLRDHIERMDQGKFYAVDDLAVVLRLLVHPGRGNDLLQRLLDSADVQPLTIAASRPPERDAIFSLGRLPARAGTEHLGSEILSLGEWINSPVMSVEIGDDRKTWTWAGFINVYANKWGGAHLDDEIPVNLSVIDRYVFGGYSLSGYLLRSAGAVVWRAAQGVLSELLLSRVSDPPIDRRADARITSVGDSSDPADRLAFGEPQFLAYRGDAVDLLILMSRHAECRATVAVGGKLSYEIAISPEQATNLAAPDSVPRIPASAELTADDFSESRTLAFRLRAFCGD